MFYGQFLTDRSKLKQLGPESHHISRYEKVGRCNSFRIFCKMAIFAIFKICILLTFDVIVVEGYGQMLGDCKSLSSVVYSLSTSKNALGSHTVEQVA